MAAVKFGIIPISVFIITYNQESTIIDAIKSIFNQSYPIDQLVISDDYSSDRTWETVCKYMERSKKPKHVRELIVRRNDNNLGLLAHNNLLVSMMRNDFFLGHAGDDISHHNRIKELVSFYNRLDRPRHYLFHSQVRALDIPGRPILTPPVVHRNMKLDDATSALSLHYGASSNMSKTLWDMFGDITIDGTYEDLILGFRAALTKSYFYIPSPLIYYRTRGGLSDPEMFHREADGGSRMIYNLRMATYKQRLIDSRTIGNLAIGNILESLIERYNHLPDDFDPISYLKCHNDVRESGMDPIDHYINFGMAEGRKYKLPTTR